MTGHVRRRGERSWELKYDAGADPASGKRKTRYASFKGTKSDAQKELVRLVAAEQSGLSVDPSRATVSAFLERWDRDWMSVNVSPKTAERYREIIRLHLIAHIGAISMQKLRPVNLSELYAKLQKETGLAARTVGHVHRVIHRALGHAAQWGVVQSNIATLVRPPRVATTEIKILSAESIKAALAHLEGKGLYPLVLTALGTGARRGEILALRWQDIDLDRAAMRIEWSLETTKAGLRFKEPKTKHGRRSIALPAYLVTQLRSHRKARQEQNLALGAGKLAPDALVFPAFDGRPRCPDALSKEWAAVAKGLKLGVTLHALRHTHASQLIASGVDVLTISRRLGHGSPTITLGVYGHLFGNTDDGAARALDAAFSSP